MKFCGDLFLGGKLFLQNVTGTLHNPSGRIEIMLRGNDTLPRAGQVFELRTTGGLALTVCAKTVLVSDECAVAVLEANPVDSLKK